MALHENLAMGTCWTHFQKLLGMHKDPVQLKHTVGSNVVQCSVLTQVKVSQQTSPMTIFSMPAQLSMQEYINKSRASCKCTKLIPCSVSPLTQMQCFNNLIPYWSSASKSWQNLYICMTAQVHWRANRWSSSTAYALSSFAPTASAIYPYNPVSWCHTVHGGSTELVKLLNQIVAVASLDMHNCMATWVVTHLINKRIHDDLVPNTLTIVSIDNIDISQHHAMVSSDQLTLGILDCILLWASNLFPSTYDRVHFC